MKHFGKIEKVRFGSGGYQNEEFGLTLSFLYGRGARKSITTLIQNMPAVGETLKSAGVSDLFDLRDVPVEVEIDNEDRLVSWRVLKEVL